MRGDRQRAPPTQRGGTLARRRGAGASVSDDLRPRSRTSRLLGLGRPGASAPDVRPPGLCDEFVLFARHWPAVCCGGQHGLSLLSQPRGAGRAWNQNSGWSFTFSTLHRSLSPSVLECGPPARELRHLAATLLPPLSTPPLAPPERVGQGTLGCRLSLCPISGPVFIPAPRGRPQGWSA